jgi:hypothetical protein
MMTMKKRTYFDSDDFKGWPDPQKLRPYFFAPFGEEWFHTGGNDGALIEAEGVDGTDDLQPNTGRVDLRFWMCGIPRLGVLLSYDKIGGGLRESYCSKGNLKRLNEWVRNLHNTPLPVGLFIPFDAAWHATKELIETNGKLPRCIEWIADNDLPPGTFPDP